MKTPINPFITSGYFSPEYFCDREAESENLMHELINGLGLGGPSEMQDFLKRCAQSGVPLDELTDEVLIWLKSKGFAASLRIVTR